MVGVGDQSKRARLLREKNLNLEIAVGIVRTQEIADEHIRMLTGPSTSTTCSVNVLKKKRKQKKKQQKKPQSDSGGDI